MKELPFPSFGAFGGMVTNVKKKFACCIKYQIDTENS